MIRPHAPRRARSNGMTIGFGLWCNAPETSPLPRMWVSRVRRRDRDPSDCGHGDYRRVPSRPDRYARRPRAAARQRVRVHVDSPLAADPRIDFPRAMTRDCLSTTRFSEERCRTCSYTTTGRDRRDRTNICRNGPYHAIGVQSRGDASHPANVGGDRDAVSVRM